ncbi:ribosome biogenesis protein tsr1 [Tieghemiomyces parasiticus]|uniref:Ribosome biogenesis protein tsr1 n=1 Tax=Tieghemiomyces parasiticus TaxID=78921 RepID=A0A9W8E020_9FUNG|nr:ribosome biogenesis protein tsr1 [Tieghemiomyces parasiticus]
MARETGDFHHRSTLTQKNKPFKSRHATKGALKARAKGKVQRMGVKRKALRTQTKAERRNSAKVAQQLKREALANANRIFTGRHRTPKIVAIVPLCPDASALQVARQLFAAVDQTHPAFDADTKHDQLGMTVPFHVDRFKQSFQLVQLPRHFWQIMDVTKVADYVVFALSATVEVDAFGEACLSAIQAQGCGTTFATVDHLDTITAKARNDTKKSLMSFMHFFFPETEKLHALDAPQDTLGLVRSLASQHPRTVHWREWRPYLMVDQLEYQPESADGQTGALRVTGFLRGNALSADRLVHLPNHGDFQVRQVVAAPYPFAGRSGNNTGEAAMDTDLEVLDTPNPETRDDLVAENEPDLLQNEQTWPTEEELAEADSRIERLRKGVVFEGEMDLSGSQVTRRVPKGTSSYQAEWIVDSEDEDGSDLSSDEDMSDGMNDEGVEIPTVGLTKHAAEAEEYEDVALETDQMSVANYGSDDDEEVDADEAARALEDHKRRQKERREANDEELAYPDEVDTPTDVSARVRFQKYRGLENFRNSPWDPYENLPLDYGRIFQFRSYRRAQRRVREVADDAPVGAGRYVTLVLAEVPATVAAAWHPSISVWTMFGLLQHEHKMSVLNFNLTRSTEYTEPIRSKDRVLLQYGYRRLWVNPIYSHSSGGGKGTNNVHKFSRFFQPGNAAVATIFAPIQFGPVHALMFHSNATPGVQLDTGLPADAATGLDTSRTATVALTREPLPLMATGQLLEASPTRIVAKRVVLTGDIYRVHRRSAVIRHMFFNREDVMWFKPVEIYTKQGRRGHLRAPIGSHGYTKCIFNGQVKQIDHVCMNLYKRVFPKWTTAPCTLAPPDLSYPQDWQAETLASDDTMMVEEDL